MRRPICVLSIAGSDSGGGAGIQSDIRTIQALGGYALTAVTAVTAQNTQGVSQWKNVPPALIRAQIQSVVADFPIRAVKTGLLSGAATVHAVASALEKISAPLVIDPVIGSSSGTLFLDPRALKKVVSLLFPLAALVTPNWPEAAILTGQPVENYADAEAAGRTLLGTGCGAVLIKGGHAPGKTCRDCLVLPGEKVRWYSSARIITRNTHGTGCVLSSAIATFLAQGEGVEEAVAQARQFLIRALRDGRGIRLGKGRGPAFPNVLK